MSVRVFDCPQCGAPVTLRASTAVFAVCEHCRSMVVVRGSSAEVTGVMAVLPPDLSPFQIGTRGEWQGRGFEIVGRVRVDWEEGTWNEWCILYDATKTGWLAEAQGLLMISFATEVAEKLPTSIRDYLHGKQMRLNGTLWTVSDVKNVTHPASEGELPFVAPPQQTRTSVDLMNPGGGFATIELADDQAEVYIGEYVDFDELKFANLRPVPGWNAEVAQEKGRTTALTCPSCGGAVQLRAAGYSMSAVCGSCGVVIDTSRPEVQVIQNADIANRTLAPLLPIGQRGKLFGTDYEVIGFVTREDRESHWSEYLLFNPWQGFRWLVTFEGHWSFIERVPTISDLTSNVIEWKEHVYKFYAKNMATVTGVLGEFYWKVRRGERAEVCDYVAPPHILSKEVYPGLNEFAWSHGIYVEPRLIAEAFGVKLPSSGWGVYLNQPNPYGLHWNEIRLPFFAALCALIFLQAYFVQNRPEVELTSAHFQYQRPPAIPAATTLPSAPPAEPTPLPSTPHFTVTGADQRVTIEVAANVNNSWLDLDLDLVNVKTNASYPAEVEVSYYYGSDSDGPWSEGAQTATVSLPAIPPGEYFLTAEPTADPQLWSTEYSVHVTRGGVYASNLIVMLAAVLFYPAMLLWRRHTFEQERWGDAHGYAWQTTDT
ncbi:MAG TPA: DUF4178 domain-containing protein [Chthoniobacter sp.]|jgi:hypothetical protein